MTLRSDGKYVVFKVDEWDATCQRYEVAQRDELEDASLGDCVVIRHQDVFAGPGLAAYANAVQTFIEAVEQLGTPIAQESYLGTMRDLRDYFMTQAQAAFEYPHKKVPD